MPNTFNTRLWGKHFCIESRFNYNPLHGYKLAGKQKRFRIPVTGSPNQIENVRLERTDLSLHLHNTLWKTHEQAEKSLSDINTKKSHFFNSVSESLGKKVVLLELNFDGFRMFSQDESKGELYELADVADSKQFKQISNDLKLDFNLLYNALLHDPVVAENVYTRDINKKLFNFLNNSFPKKLPESELLVITGELVWSRWLDLYSIIELISSFKPNYQQVLLDFQGIWQLVIHAEGRGKELLQLNKSFFEPNFTYLADKKETKSHKGFLELVLSKKSKEKKLFITPERSGLFKLDDEGYRAGNYEFAELVYFDFLPAGKGVLTDDKKFKSWFKSEAIEQELYADYKTLTLPLTFRSVTQNKISPGGKIELMGGLKMGDKVSFGQDFAFFKPEDDFLVETKYKGELLKKILKASEGEYVKQGDTIAEVPGILGKIGNSYKSPEQGMIDLTYINDGAITVKKQLQKQLLTAPFDSKITGIEKTGAVYLEAETTNLPLQFFEGKSTGGMLCKSVFENNGIEQLLLLEKIKDFDLSFKEIVELKIRGIIFYSVDYQEFIEFITKESKKLKLINLIVIEQFGKDPDLRLKKLMERNIGNYVFTEEFLLKFPVITDKLAIAESRPAKILAKEATLNKGDFVRFASYKLKDSYARIENVQDSYCVIIASDNINQVARDNILSEL